MTDTTDGATLSFFLVIIAFLWWRPRERLLRVLISSRSLGHLAKNIPRHTFFILRSLSGFDSHNQYRANKTTIKASLPVVQHQLVQQIQRTCHNPTRPFGLV